MVTLSSNQTEQDLPDGVDKFRNIIHVVAQSLITIYILIYRGLIVPDVALTSVLISASM